MITFSTFVVICFWKKILELLLFSSQLHQCNTLTGCVHQKHMSHILSVPRDKFVTLHDKCVKM